MLIMMMENDQGMKIATILMILILIILGSKSRKMSTTVQDTLKTPVISLKLSGDESVQLLNR